MTRNCSKRQGQQKRPPSSAHTSGDSVQNWDPCLYLPITLLFARSCESKLPAEVICKASGMVLTCHARGCSLASRDEWQNPQNPEAVSWTFFIAWIFRRKLVSWGLLARISRMAFSQFQECLHVPNDRGPKSKCKAHLLPGYFVHIA